MALSESIAGGLARARGAAERFGRGAGRVFGALFPHSGLLCRYALLSYGLVLVNGAGLLTHAQWTGVSTGLFIVAAYLVYGAMLPLPALALTLGADALTAVLPRSSVRAQRTRTAAVCAFAILLFGLAQILVFADRFVFKGYGFHLNSFVWNLITTPGGIESMGAGASAQITFTLIALGLVGAEAALMWVALTKPVVRAWSAVAHPRGMASMIAVFVLLALFQAVAYGVSSLYDYRPVTRASEVIPHFQRVTFRRMARKFGINPPRAATLKTTVAEGALNYPLRPIERAPEAPRWNIVWLVAESWRGDMLSPEIMPETWAFAQKSVRFDHHYSSGNSTRMGLFGMFYGLYGNYWFSALRELREPVLMELLAKDNYQLQMYTSAKFTYPEFERTLFAGVSPEALHQNNEKLAGWECDARFVGEMLEYIRGRDPARPFMTFMFFESPHARYYFPPECAIRTPYLEDFNYATVNLERDAPLIFNRYVNSCRHLDVQFGRVLRGLEAEGLLDSTIVLITGDHGEEFMEHGRWGHSSAYNEEQTVVPLVLRAPGLAPAVIDRMTSHLDVPATLLNMLGVTNPPEDYSSGADLLSGPSREYAVICDWGSMAYVDAEYKAVFPTGASGVRTGHSVSDANDVLIADERPFLQSRKEQLVRVMNEMSRFTRR